MPRRKHEPEEIVARPRQVDVAVTQGVALAWAIRGIAESEATCRRRRSECGGLQLDQAMRLEELEQEASRPRRTISDVTSTGSS